MVKYKEGFCPICGCEEWTYVSAYREHPFVDGKRYPEMCWTCANVPKNWEILQFYDDGFCVHDTFLKVYNTFDPNRLFTIKEMMEDGFSKEEASRSIKAVKNAIKRNLQYSGLIRHVVTLPVGYGVKPSVSQPNKIEEEDMSRRGRKYKNKKNRQRNQNARKLKNQQPRPFLVEHIEIREKNNDSSVAW